MTPNSVTPNSVTTNSVTTNSVTPNSVAAPDATRRAAVIGSPIAHSLSPVLHRAAYESLGLAGYSYDRFEVREHELADFVDTLGPEWAGLSMTMPLKRVAIPLLDEVSPLVQAIGSCNTMVFDPSRRGEGGRVWRYGDNTDVQGVIGALGDAGIHPGEPGREAHGPAVIIGGGATAASALAGLQRLGWRQVHLAVRSAERAAEVVAVGGLLGVDVQLCPLAEATDLLAHADVTIGTVPGPALAELADRAHVHERSEDEHPPVLLDAIYEGWPTPMAQAWQRLGGIVVSGLDMLIHQAVGQVELFTGRAPAVTVLRDALPD